MHGLCEIRYSNNRRSYGVEIMSDNKREYILGLFSILGAMIIWGVLPIYWQALIPIDSKVIILYRIVTVFIYGVIACRFQYSFARIFEPLKDKSIRIKYFSAGVIVTINWSLYIYAVNSNQIVQSSLGYFIQPLIICIIGYLIFKEKLNKYNLTAITFAMISVLILLVHFKQLPSLALLLATSFAVYTAIKKTVQQPPLISLVYESIILVPPALIAIIYLECTGKGALAVASPGKFALMLLCGLVTLIPLGMFAYSATRCPMFQLGLIEYLSPTISLAIGILFLGESLDKVQVYAFILIWVGIIIFSYGEYNSYRKNPGNSDDESA